MYRQQSQQILSDMDFRGELAHLRIAIIGLGLMGGSLALALKNHCAELFGFDSDDQIVELANQMNIADLVTNDFSEVLPLADIVILAVPVCSIIDILDGLPENPVKQQVIVDIGSTKYRVIEKMNQLPPGYDPIGGHPICGKEKSSLAYADSNLYRGATFVLVQSERTGLRAKSLVKEIIEVIGAIPLWMGAGEHDELVAITSHFPYLLANAMVMVTPLKTKSLIGPGFRSTARIAGSSVEMMADILMSNRDNVVNQIRLFLERINKIQETIESGDRVQLINILEEGTLNYNRLIQDP